MDSEQDGAGFSPGSLITLWSGSHLQEPGGEDAKGSGADKLGSQPLRCTSDELPAIRAVGAWIRVAAEVRRKREIERDHSGRKEAGEVP